MTKASSILLSIALVITGFATLVLGNYIVFAIAVTTNPDWNGLAASNTLTFTGNVSNGELVNITYGDAIYRFEFNTSHPNNGTDTLTANAIRVNLTTGYNFSWLASGNLTNAINANVSTAAIVTASNTTNVTTLTADSVGRFYNSLYATSENLASASWASTSLTGGKDIVYGQSSTISYAGVVIPLMGILLMVVGFVMLLATVKGFSLGTKSNFKADAKTGVREMYTGNERSSSSGDERG